MHRQAVFLGFGSAIMAGHPFLLLVSALVLTRQHSILRRPALALMRLNGLAGCRGRRDSMGVGTPA